MLPFNFSKIKNLIMKDNIIWKLNNYKVNYKKKMRK